MIYAYLKYYDRVCEFGKVFLIAFDKFLLLQQLHFAYSSKRMLYKFETGCVASFFFLAHSCPKERLAQPAQITFSLK